MAEIKIQLRYLDAQGRSKKKNRWVSRSAEMIQTEEQTFNKCTDLKIFAMIPRSRYIYIYFYSYIYICTCISQKKRKEWYRNIFK